MAVKLSPVGGVAGQFFDNSGNPLSGGKLYTYAAGTTTPVNTYTSTAGVTAHTNPIILDAGGRVPGGEIWFTDGLVYKLVQKTSADVLIGTYDNIIGINSNFINFLAQEEIQTATAGQTVFTLATVNYQPGTNSLSVFVDGVNQYDGSSYSYVETDGTTVTFTAGLHVGALVKFTTAQSLSSGATDASIVTYTPAGTGAVSTTAQAKLRESVSVLDFGASLSAAVTAIGSTRTTLIINTDITVSASLTVPFNISIEVINQAVITIATATTLTINGPFYAGMCQAFTYVSGSSSVLFGQGTKMVIPQWWGATGNGSTVAGDIQNETDAMVSCFCSLRHSFITSNWANNSTLGPATVYIPRGVYAINKGLPIFLNVHVTGEGGNNSPLSFLVQQDLTQPIFQMIPQAYNANWTVAYETVSTGTIYAIGFGSYQGATFSNTNAPAIKCNSIRQATTYCNANFGASGGSAVAIGGYSDLHFKYVRWVNVAGACMFADDCSMGPRLHDSLIDNSQQGIVCGGSVTGGILIQHSDIYTVPGGAIQLEPTSGTGISLEIFDCRIFAGEFAANNKGAISLTNPATAADTKITIDSVEIYGYDYSTDKYRGGVRLAHVQFVRIQNNRLAYLDDLGAGSFITANFCDVIQITGNTFQSDVLTDYVASAFISLYNTTAGWLINISGNQFINKNATPFVNVVAGGVDYTNSAVTFSNNQILGNVTTVLSSNVSLVNNFNNLGAAYPTVLYLSGVPGFGTWKVGDIVYNTVPASGGNIGWVCTTAPSTWKTFGAIA